MCWAWNTNGVHIRPKSKQGRIHRKGVYFLFPWLNISEGQLFFHYGKENGKKKSKKKFSKKKKEVGKSKSKSEKKKKKNSLCTILIACFPIHLDNKSYISSFAIPLENSLSLHRHDQMPESWGNITALGSFFWLPFGEHGNKTMSVITAKHSEVGFDIIFSLASLAICKTDWTDTWRHRKVVCLFQVWVCQF